MSAAALTGEASALKHRVERLLAPPTETTEARANTRGALSTVAVSLLLALALGAIFGEQVVRALFWIAA